jgi:hypothetical protein
VFAFDIDFRAEGIWMDYIVEFLQERSQAQLSAIQRLQIHPCDDGGVLRYLGYYEIEFEKVEGDCVFAILISS